MLVGAKPWLGLVAAPLMFLANLQVSFMLAPWVCAAGNHWTIHAAHLTTLLLIALCGVLGSDAMRRDERGQSFLATLSVTMSAFTSVALIAHWIPNFILGACE